MLTHRRGLLAPWIEERDLSVRQPDYDNCVEARNAIWQIFRPQQCDDRPAMCQQCRQAIQGCMLKPERMVACRSEATYDIFGQGAKQWNCIKRLG